MLIRPYQPADCRELANLFYNTVHTVNAQDYTPQQLAAWATGQVNLAEWNQSLLEHFSLVALDGDIITGFGDIAKCGYLDRLFVHQDYQRQGIASALCDRLEQSASGEILTHASITARPFFAQRGYQVIQTQQVERCGVMLENYVMVKKQ